MFELTKQFRFDAAHTLPLSARADANRRIHGHSYRAEITLRGTPDPRTGMLMDLATFEDALASARDALDHRFLDEVHGLGPATLENLCAWVWQRLAPALPLLARVAIHRDGSGERCAYDGPTGAAR